MAYSIRIRQLYAQAGILILCCTAACGRERRLTASGPAQARPLSEDKLPEIDSSGFPLPYPFPIDGLKSLRSLRKDATPEIVGEETTVDINVAPNGDEVSLFTIRGLVWAYGWSPRSDPQKGYILRDPACSFVFSEKWPAAAPLRAPDCAIDFAAPLRHADRPTAFAKLVPGKTNLREVLAALGRPDHQWDRWFFKDYRPAQVGLGLEMPPWIEDPTEKYPPHITVRVLQYESAADISGYVWDESFTYFVVLELNKDKQDLSLVLYAVAPPPPPEQTVAGVRQLFGTPKEATNLGWLNYDDRGVRFLRSQGDEERIVAKLMIGSLGNRALKFKEVKEP